MSSFTRKGSGMDMMLKGRLALITGSSSGLGKIIAHALAQNGCNVIINGRNKETLDIATAEIRRETRVNIHHCQLDASNDKAIREYFKNNTFWLRQLDILVNNVGNIENFGKFEELSDEDWQRSFDLTFMSAARFIRAALPCLKNSGRPRIINISSLSGHQPSFNGLNPHYGFAKAGLINLTKNLANDLGRYGITVNAICPSTLAGGGWHSNVIDRASRERISKSEAERLMRKEEDKKSPLGIMGQLEDVANLVVYLSSVHGRFLTGHCYNVDGGITRGL